MEPSTTTQHAAEPYVERYGFDLKSTAIMLSSAVFTAILLFDLLVKRELSLAVVLPGLLLFGVGGGFFLTAMLSRRVALRVDERGIVLGGIPTGVGAWRRDIPVPWERVDAIVLFRQTVPGRWAVRQPYIGVHLRQEWQDAYRDSRAPIGRINAALIPHVHPDVIALSRPINAWRLRHDQFAMALSAYAPQVPVTSDDPRAGH